jgi:hypothetical protein
LFCITKHTKQSYKMSGIVNPLKKVTLVPRSDYKEICQRIQDGNDKADREIIEKRLSAIRVDVTTEFEKKKAHLLKYGGDDYFVYSHPIARKDSVNEYEYSLQTKLISVLTDELKLTLSASRICEYDDDKYHIKFKIPLVSD